MTLNWQTLRIKIVLQCWQEHWNYPFRSSTYGLWSVWHYSGAGLTFSSCCELQTCWCHQPDSPRHWEQVSSNRRSSILTLPRRTMNASNAGYGGLQLWLIVFCVQDLVLCCWQFFMASYTVVIILKSYIKFCDCAALDWSMKHFKIIPLQSCRLLHGNKLRC